MSSTFSPLPLALAAVVSAAVALGGFRARALTAGGAALAFLVGFLVLVGTGWAGGLALAVFFIGSSVVSKLAERYEPAWIDAPGNRRNLRQVAANGAAAAIGGLVGWLADPALGGAIVVCALAGAAADTWATSWGMSAPGDPVDVWRRTQVPKGTSGAVSWRGTVGGLGGGALVAASPLLLGVPPSLFAAGVVSAAIGMLGDSLLGATLQGRFICPSCDLPSERRVHRCGAATRLTGGWRALDNDGVNLIATAIAGLGGLAWWALR